MRNADIAEFISNHGVDLSWQDSFYQWMHENPELSLQEEQTAKHIIARLAQMDCEVTTGIGGHGVTAVFRNPSGAGADEPTVLMRADFDALPVQETTGLPYASKNDGVMHACGHDMHATALMGLCAVLDERRDAWHGTFIALFQPAEEVTAGASNMINDGLADKIPMGAAMNKGLTFRMGQTHVQRWTADLLRRIEEEQIDPSFVITHEVPLDKGPEMYRTFRDKADGCIKVMLQP